MRLCVWLCSQRFQGFRKPKASRARRAHLRETVCAHEGRSTALCLRFFIQKLCRYWADRASEGSLASKPMQGDKMRVFSRLCARFPGWLPMCFFARTRFLEVCAATFLANRAGICPHIAGRVIGTRGTRCAQKFQYSPSATRARSYAPSYFSVLFFRPPSYFSGGFFGYGGVASSFSAGAAPASQPAPA